MSGSVKFLLFLVIAASVALGTLYFMGGKKQEYQVGEGASDGGFEIRARAEQVFPYLAEPELIKQWIGGIVELEKIEDDTRNRRNKNAPGEERLGAVYRLVLEQDGEQQEYTQNIFRYRENENVSYRSVGESQVITQIFVLEPETESTLFTYRLKVTPRGLARLVAPFADPQDYLNKIHQDAERLRELVENAVQDQVVEPSSDSESDSGDASSTEESSDDTNVETANVDGQD